MSSKIGNYSHCTSCGAVVPKNKCYCLKCDNDRANKITKLLEDLAKNMDPDKAYERLLQPDNGIERAIARLNEKEKESN